MGFFTWFENVLAFVKVVSVIVGGVWAILQWVRQNDYKRGELIGTITKKIREDVVVAEVSHIIDWGGMIHFDDIEKIFVLDIEYVGCLSGKSDLEIIKTIDAALSVFDYLCYLNKTKQLKDEDILSFQYELTVIVKNNAIKDYLKYIYHYASEQGTTAPFFYLISYASKKGLLDLT